MARSRSRHTVRLVVVAGVAGFALVLGSVPAFAVTTTPILHSNLVEELPAGGGGYLFWSQNSTQSPTHEDLFGKKSGKPKFQINAHNTLGFAGAIDGNRVIYQQTNSGRSQSDLFFYNLDTGLRTKLPAPVNTDDWEYYPSMSGDEIAFTRQALSTGNSQILLWHKGDHTAKGLDHATGPRAQVHVGQINGNFVVWDHCDAQNKCQVFEHDIEASTTTKLPGRANKSQYSPSVTSDGTVFFGRSGIGCGTHASIVEDPLDGPQKTVVTLPVGIDFAHSNVVIGANPTAVLFDHYDCNAAQFDIYRFTV